MRISCYRQTDSGQEVEITLKGDECSNFLNFVIKDSSTGTWHDFYGDNFHVPLRLALSSMALDESMDEETQVLDGDLPELAGELTGIWAYIKWEHDGCPNRSQQESDAEYRRGIQARSEGFKNVWNACGFHGMQKRFFAEMYIEGP